MNRKRRLICTLLGFVGAFSLLFGTFPGPARADIANPVTGILELAFSTWWVVAVCAIVVAAVAHGVFFIRRARAKRW